MMTRSPTEGASIGAPMIVDLITNMAEELTSLEKFKSSSLNVRMKVIYTQNEIADAPIDLISTGEELEDTWDEMKIMRSSTPKAKTSLFASIVMTSMMLF
ncbi:hypothetical protein RIF29_00684 [Crotalaria pallida]|uniref:Uncharacterized protein n=1 Tax=Crotalaria pallida TaxID=3830 RepID=A0AAN9IXS2_CROPI